MDNVENVENTSKVVRLCDDLINGCYEGRVSYPVELTSRVREIKETVVGELDHFREAAKMVGDNSAMREALVRALEYCESDQRSGIAYSDNDVLVPMLREALDAQQPSQGNAAAMREAAVNALWCLNWMAENTGDKPTKDHLAKPIELLTAALAVPPRNCDRLQTVEEAKTARHDYKTSCPTPPGGWGDADLLDWFLAKAEGEEG